MGAAKASIQLIVLAVVSPNGIAAFSPDCTWYKQEQMQELSLAQDKDMSSLLAIARCPASAGAQDDYYLVSRVLRVEDVCKFEVSEIERADEAVEFMALTGKSCPNPSRELYAQVTGVAPKHFNAIAKGIRGAARSQTDFNRLTKDVPRTLENKRTLDEFRSTLQVAGYRIWRVDGHRELLGAAATVWVLVLAESDRTKGFVLTYRLFLGTLSLRAVEIAEF